MVELYEQLRDAIKCSDEGAKHMSLLEVEMQAIVLMHCLDGDESADAIEVYLLAQEELARMNERL